MESLLEICYVTFSRTLHLLGAVRRATLEDVTLLGSDEENLRIIRMEHHTHAAALQLERAPVRATDLVDIEKQRDNRRNCELVLHQHPVEDAPVAGNGEEVNLAVLHVRAPLELPHALRVLPVDPVGHVDRLLGAHLQVVHDHVSVVQANRNQVRVLGMDIAAHRARFGRNWVEKKGKKSRK